ncbi:hypothetical protein Anas_11966 [Armadillidium nasatum]|uniref:Membrane protein BRI3 n=1 Tax=Armadillidium nasatum TaxID=96803 RepID=A0A5N5SP51_9CRUS|nr:hypothetical protein Anas_11966 [Armadillidium nasatum]
MISVKIERISVSDVVSPPPSYSEAYHQQGNAGGKPIYVRGPPPPPPPPPVGFYPTQPTTVTYHPQSVVVTQPHTTQYVVPVTEVHHVGPGICPACRVGVLTEGFTCLGVMCCILFVSIWISLPLFYDSKAMY